MSTLIIKDLHAEVDGKEILKGVNLEITGGETHAIMGPNGTGKSTLASVIMGHPRFDVTKGTITLDGQDVLAMEVDERARAGLFLGMQHPAEVPGVTNSDFIKTAINSRMEEGKSVSLFKFIRELDHAIEDLKMEGDLPHRYLNEGFSGGEKKRNEVLQMKMLKPSIAILDEIDSGLDVDALKVVGENVTSMKSKDLGLLLITHYQRLLDYITADKVHVMMKGRIVKSGDMELIRKIDTEGYDWIKEEVGIDDVRVIEDDEQARVMLGVCATKEALDL
ncbi:Fe-S cluster assembly ATPase SufC [Candidatus Xianfuyuplasma coldseepsis]|uniref:Fe-S cluster assembly ATPase SufC n=1 Tax=Candidatus Xianfuyuplasma coldseepsis TaxID=2782163 RepID=A0A7L7KP59_9MOLU|nr:Fe-S cluster assembly ATPase SufC [Xianfuyuplasma coldseepsis]QMS84447.1 Fe-S cluster assembly ATPase SufC [Xianfuyuplasma coldseepsis]